MEAGFFHKSSFNPVNTSKNVPCYVVFRGLGSPGVYTCWCVYKISLHGCCSRLELCTLDRDQVAPLVVGVPGSLYQLCSSFHEACGRFIQAMAVQGVLATIFPYCLGAPKLEDYVSALDDSYHFSPAPIPIPHQFLPAVTFQEGLNWLAMSPLQRSIELYFPFPLLPSPISFPLIPSSSPPCTPSSTPSLKSRAVLHGLPAKPSRPPRLSHPQPSSPLLPKPPTVLPPFSHFNTSITISDTSFLSNSTRQELENELLKDSAEYLVCFRDYSPWVYPAVYVIPLH